MLAGLMGVAGTAQAQIQGDQVLFHVLRGPATWDQTYTFDQLSPRPAGLEQYREQMRLRQLEEERQRQEQQKRDEIERKG